MSEKGYEVLDRPDILSVLFYPRRDVGVPRLSAGIATIRIPVAEGIAIGGKVYAARAGAPAIIYFHGNGEIASDYDTIAPLYTSLGITLVVLDYRGYGTSDGAPSASALIADARACFAGIGAVLAEKGITTGKLFVMGRSLGSAAALEVADHAGEALAGLILESGFAYTFPLIERIGFLQVGDAYEHRDGFGNLEKIARITLPTLIIHGERDWIIPIGDAEALYDAAGASSKSLVRIPSAGHNDLMLIGRKAYFKAIGWFCGAGSAADDAPDDDQRTLS
jgi:alpha-beta hydrolase superfamily lysophospholipase